MKIRAITIGVPVSFIENDYDRLENILNNIQDLKKILEKNQIELETIRLCTNPFDKNTHLNQSPFFNNPEVVLEILDDLVKQNLINYYSAFPGLCDQVEKLSNTQIKLIQKIPELLHKHQAMFASIQVSSSKNGINLEGIQQCASLIRQNATYDAFQNLKFAVTFNVEPNTPFFPSAFHFGENPRISIALEAADEIVKIVEICQKQNQPLSWIQSVIKIRFEEIYDKLTGLLSPFCIENQIEFVGIDFSPAQYSTKEKSIGTAIELLNLGNFGDVGTVFGVGFLTSSLQKINRPKIGFSGFMQPLLEDYTIALRHKEDRFDIFKLLLNSTVCGLGLDCIPLPGDIEEHTLSLLFMDTAMVSTRLHKPLTARLMPIPGKNEGDLTEFQFEYITNSKVCKVSKSEVRDLDEIIKRNPGLLI
jgi:uncharacterized protein (UPF0210 family)